MTIWLAFTSFTKLVLQLLVNLFVFLHLTMQTSISLLQLLQCLFLFLEIHLLLSLFQQISRLSQLLHQLGIVSRYLADKLTNHLSSHLAFCLLNLIQLIVNLLFLLQPFQLRLQHR